MEKKQLKFPFASILIIVGVLFRYSVMNDYSSWFPVFGYPNGYLTSTPLLLLEMVSYISLAILLFMKKRDWTIILPVSGILFAKGIVLVKYYEFIKGWESYGIAGDVFPFIATLLLLIIVCICFERTNADLHTEKASELCIKIFFIPAVFLVFAFIGLNELGVRFVHNIAGNLRYWKIFFNQVFKQEIIYAIDIFIYLLLAHWMTHPFKKEITTDSKFVSDNPYEAYCPLGKHILLCLFTFGIWYMIWIYRTTRYLNRASSNSSYYDPTNKLLLCIFIPFYQVYWYYKHGEKVDILCSEKSLPFFDTDTLCMVLSIFIPIVACGIMQSRINAICASKPVKTQAIEQLREYKKLLDEGVITQEEYDLKKKNLLNS